MHMVLPPTPPMKSPVPAGCCWAGLSKVLIKCLAEEVVPGKKIDDCFPAGVVLPA